MLYLWNDTADCVLRAPWIAAGVLSVEEYARDRWSQYMWWGVASDNIPISNVGSSRAPRYGLYISLELLVCCLWAV